MNKKNILVSLVLSFGIIGASIFGFTASANANDIKINQCMNQMYENINGKVKDDPVLAFSSNPYDYIKHDEAYAELVSLGPEIIPSLYNRISTSENNGLQEYIYAIAAEEILQVDLKKVSIKNYKWSNAKEWADKFYSFSNDIELNIDIIMQEDNSDLEKIKKINELGILAIPYIKENPSSGYIDDSIKTLDYRLLSDCKYVSEYMKKLIR